MSGIYMTLHGIIKQEMGFYEQFEELFCVKIV